MLLKDAQRRHLPVEDTSFKETASGGTLPGLYITPVSAMAPYGNSPKFHFSQKMYNNNDISLQTWLLK